MERLSLSEVCVVGQVFLEEHRAVRVDHLGKLEVDAVHVHELQVPFGCFEVRDPSSVIRHLVREEDLLNLASVDQKPLKDVCRLHNQLV